MASSVIFFNKGSNESVNRPQQITTPVKPSNTSELSGLDFLASKARCVKE